MDPFISIQVTVPGQYIITLLLLAISVQDDFHLHLLPDVVQNQQPVK
jgi:hypothetical protein